MKNEEALREELAGFLAGGKAHMTLGEAVKDFPLEQINNKPQHVEYTFWHLLEHIRITQNDIVDFIKNTEYKEPHWPDDDWPKKDAQATENDWKESIRLYEVDLQEMI